MKEKDTQDRWGEYNNLINKENSQDPCDNMAPVSDLITAITRAEVGITLQKMNNGKAVGPDGIPAEASKACAVAGIAWLMVLQ